MVLWISIALITGREVGQDVIDSFWMVYALI